MTAEDRRRDMSKEIEELAEIIKNNSNKWLQDKFALELNTKPFEFLAKAILDAGYTKSPIDTEKLTVISDEDFIKWCGEQDTKRCSKMRNLRDSSGYILRIIPPCEDCRAEAQLAHTKQEIKKQMEGK